jgi:long-chain acyl-CoA synthetase
MQGYWNRPDETANVMVDGWLRTGDVGYMDADGYIYLTDRIKDVILCGGFNVYPRVIEEAIYEHPAVAEVAVVGIPDAYRGQSPKAFIRLREHGDLDETGLRAFLAEKISKIEMPTAFEFREELPKTSVGKLSKKTLQDEEAARASAGGAAADLDGSGTPAQAPADTPEANARA